jgi:uncharacterized membrane protein YcjF (UPF0283 family)
LDFRRPQTSEVFAFRQLQGTGEITFKYASREKSKWRNDLLLAALLILVIGLLTYAGGFLISSWQRAAGFLFILCLIASLNTLALDLALPGLVIAILLFFAARKKQRASATAE